MIDGRYDFHHPVDSCQEPMFQSLGASPQSKRHVLFDSGHIPPMLPTIKETLDWLDAHLGPVKADLLWEMLENAGVKRCYELSMTP